MNKIIFILFAIGLITWGLYALMKMATKNALREYDREKNEQSDDKFL